MTDLTKSETANLISAEKVQGTTVYNHAGDKLGTVENVMIDKMSGEVAYAVMSFGGFLGLGEKYHPLPWGILVYDTDKDGYTVPLTEDQLKKAPMYGQDDHVDYNDAGWTSQVNSYYGVDPKMRRHGPGAGAPEAH